MANAAQQLLERIVRSPHFAGSEEHAGLLSYLCYQTQAGNLEDLREHDIGVAVLGLEPGYDVRENPVVSTVVEEIRERLKTFFQKEGRREQLRMAIPRGEFRAFFYEADPRQLAQAEEEPSTLEKFWAPYWSGGMRNLLIHGELPGDAMLIPEAYAAVQLGILFEKNGSSLEMFPAGAFLQASIPPANLVMIGTLQSNAVMGRFLTGPLETSIVKRIWADGTHGVLTLIVSPEPGALLDAVRFVTYDPVMERTFTELAGGEIPQNFQLTVGRR
ncbi:MAG TPA: hypothetical protein VM120_17335 [Bryobacteraceae bacterium]|nr:hypothetical protein [Bryobacteraceae bacterium]